MKESGAEFRLRKIGRGFTLIELLVVIAIIALLVAILMPSLSKAKQIAKEAKCRTNLNALGKGVNLFAAENNYFVPSGDSRCTWGPPADWLSIMCAVTWFQLRDAYLPSDDVMICPTVGGKVQYLLGWSSTLPDGTKVTSQSLRAWMATNPPSSWAGNANNTPVIASPYQYYGIGWYPASSLSAPSHLGPWMVLKIDERSTLGGVNPPLFSDYAWKQDPSYGYNHGTVWNATKCDVMVNVMHTDGSVEWKKKNPDNQPLYDFWGRQWYW